MTDTFEFDPLPGEVDEEEFKRLGRIRETAAKIEASQLATLAAAQQTAPAERPRRGPKKGPKTERKKRGARRTTVAAEPAHAMAQAQEGATKVTDKAIGRTRRSRKTVETSPEIGFVRQMMALTEAVRRKVLDTLNQVFG